MIDYLSIHPFWATIWVWVGAQLPFHQPCPQLFLEDPEAFPGFMGYRGPPAQKASLRKHSAGILTRPPNHQLTPFNMKEQQLYFKLLLDVWALQNRNALKPMEGLKSNITYMVIEGSLLVFYCCEFSNEFKFEILFTSFFFSLPPFFFLLPSSDRRWSDRSCGPLCVVVRQKRRRAAGLRFSRSVSCRVSSHRGCRELRSCWRRWDCRSDCFIHEFIKQIPKMKY